MCLAIPGKIIKLKADNKADIEIGGVTTEISVMLIEEPKIGDYVIAHTGFAISKLDPEEAEKTLQVFTEIL